MRETSFSVLERLWGYISFNSMYSRVRNGFKELFSKNKIERTISVNLNYDFGYSEGGGPFSPKPLDF